MTLILVFAFLFIVVGVGIIYFALRKNPYPIPQGAVQWMVTILCVLLVCISGLTIALVWTHQKHSSTALPSTYVEPFEFQLVSNQEKRNIADYSGRVVLLNFWATWCQPCITELPELDALQVAYHDKGLVVLTISDEALKELQLYTDLLPEETVSGYVKSEDLPESFQNELAFGRPVSYVIDGKGMIQERIRGAGNFAFFENLVTPWLAALES